MTISKFKTWKKRDWLNPSNTSNNGYIITGQDADGDAELKIADCNRIIDLDLYYSTPRGKKVVIRKLNILRDRINNLITVISERD